MGYAEQHGYRNSFGLPFQPFSLQQNKTLNFVEVPLNCMDGTFQKYKGEEVSSTAQLMIEFFEKNKHNSIISLLWHNTFFTSFKYKGYLDEYVKMLTYFQAEDIQGISPPEIVELYHDQGRK